MVFYLYISLLVLVLPLKLITDDTSGTCIDVSGTSGQVEMNLIYSFIYCYYYLMVSLNKLFFYILQNL